MLLQQVTDRLHRWLTAGRDIERLHRVDDRLLEDMGVRRDEIAQRVRGH